MLDGLIVLAFVVYSVSVGFRMRKKASRNLEEYFLAGRTLKGWQAGCSMAATQYAADTPLLVTGLIATAGIFSLWRLWVYAFAFLLMGFVIGSSWRRAKVLTDAELTELRYAGRWALALRVLKSIHIGTLVNCTVMAMVLLAATRIAEPFLLWHEWLPGPVMMPLVRFVELTHFVITSLPVSHPEVWIRSADNLISILAIVGFTALYSMTGGLRSVVATDVVQFIIAMSATFLYAWVVLDRSGGITGLVSEIRALYGTQASNMIFSFGPSVWDGVTWVFLIILGVQWFAQINADGTGYLAQRTMACQTDADAKKAAVVFTIAQVLFRSLLWLPIGLGLLVLYPAAEGLPAAGSAAEGFRVLREGTFAQGIKDFLPAGARGLMLTGMLAALASTIDTHLNWGASYWSNDLYKRFLMEKIMKRDPRSRELVWVARLSNAGILFLALFIMSRLESIQTAWHISLLFGSGLGVVLILRWIWYRINIWSEMTAAAASFVFSPLLLFGFPGMAEGERLLWMVVISTIAVLAVTLLTRPEAPETLTRFYERAEPCGFWTPVAERMGRDPRKPVRALGRALGATAVCAVSIFSFLVGFGKIFTGIPFWSWPCGGFVLLGAALVPVWLHLGFTKAGNDKEPS